jgi:cytochrome c biogenesis protein CcmG, thiol:disulfide interchange protein DsbE
MAYAIDHSDISEQMNLHRHGNVALLAVIYVFAQTGCGGPSGSQPPEYAKALKDAPPSLATLYAQGNQLVPGGEEELEDRLNQLRGYPVVVNLWASWCGNCRFEFPFFQRLSARFGTRLAFIGIDSEDSDDAATTWLDEAPVPYPSITDPDREIANSLGVLGFPSTAFYDREGDLALLKQGAYREEGQLEDQIKELLQENS